MNVRFRSLSLLAALLVLPVANAAEVPSRKPGLWQTTIQVKGTTLISQTCVDATSDAAAHAKTDAYMKANCSRLDTRQEGGKWVSDSTCTFAGTTVTGHTVTTMDGDAAIHTAGTTNADSIWLGPCKPGQKPGVPMVMPGSTKN